MSNTTEQIKEKLNIVNVVSSYIKLDKAGINLKGRCPFHNEKSPSFFVSPERGTFKCFGCGEGGDIFTFVEKFEGVDFMGALKILADRAGVEIEKEDLKVKDDRSRLYKILDTTTFFFQKNLTENSEALSYLKKRGVTIDTIKKFRLGFAKDEWRSLRSFLESRGFKDDEMEQVGLVKKNEEKIYDRFRGRIIFPIFDTSGRPVAFSGRILNDDGKSAKYLNSPETLFFNKSKILYGYDMAKEKMREKKFVILVEGQMDLLMSHQVGFTNTVATSGTALTADHLALLKRFSDKIVMAFDGDGAGISASGRATKLALSCGMEVRLVSIENDMDPADFILSSPVEWEDKVKNSEHVVDFYLNILLGSQKKGREVGVEVQHKILPFVAVIPSKIEQAYFISRISAMAKISEDALWEELKKVDLKEDYPAENDNLKRPFLSPPQDSKKNMVKNIMGLIWWQENLELKFTDVEKSKKRLKDILGDDSMSKIENIPNNRKDEIVFEIETLYEKDDERLADKFEELFINLEKKYLDEELEDAQKNLNKAEQMNDSEAVLKYSKICDYLHKKKMPNRNKI